MHDAIKDVVLVKPATYATDATNVSYLDTKGFNRVRVVVVGSAIATATTDSPTRLKIAEGASSGVLSNMTDITELVGDGVGGFDIPEAENTNDAYIVSFDIGLGRITSRYLALSLTPGTTQTCSVTAHLSKADNAPVDANSAGVLALVEY